MCCGSSGAFHAECSEELSGNIRGELHLNTPTTVHVTVNIPIHTVSDHRNEQTDVNSEEDFAAFNM